jgi:hypothetical protein
MEREMPAEYVPTADQRFLSVAQLSRAAAPMTALIGLSLYGLVQSVAVAAKGN